MHTTPAQVRHENGFRNGPFGLLPLSGTILSCMNCYRIDSCLDDPTQ